MNKPNLLLIHPDLDRAIIDLEAYAQNTFPALGIGYLASILKQHGYEVAVLDAPSFALLKLKDKKKSFLEAAEEIIVKNKVNVLGITAISQTRKKCFDLARLAKFIDKSIKVVMGGPYASLMYQQILKHYHNCIDYLIIGEGEENFLGLVKAIEKGENPPVIPGLAFCNNGKVHLNPSSKPIQDLDGVPFPDYSYHADLFPGRKIPTIGLFTSRGCPFHCEFCGSRRIWGKMRLRSPQNVVDEIEFMQSRYGTKTFRFHDDTFTVPKRRAVAILQEIIRRGIKANFYVHTRFDTVDKEILENCKEAGVKWVYYGLESGSDRIRNEMRKRVDKGTIVETARITNDLNLSMGIFVMLGYPTETMYDIYETYRVLKEINPDDVQVCITKIQPKTPLYYRALRMGIHKEEDWLNEDIEYFTFVDGAERELIYGFQILFDDIMKKNNVRTDFERNPEVGLLKRTNPVSERLKNKAFEELMCFDKTG